MKRLQCWVIKWSFQVNSFAALPFFFSVGYNGWGCGGSIFSRRCTLQCICSERVGALLLTAGALILLATIFLALFILRDEDWCIVVSAICATLAAIIGMAGVFYYINHGSLISPYLATIVMTLSIALAAFLIFDVIMSC